MNEKGVNYEYDLGNGSALTAYSIDPKIGVDGLRECVEASLLSTKEKSPLNLETLAQRIPRIRSCQDFLGLGFSFSFDKYFMPVQLHAHRDAYTLGFSDSIAVFRDGKVSSPGELIRADYRDFVSTDLQSVPSKKAPDSYTAGKTVADLLPEWEVSPDAMAKYLGFAHFLRPASKQGGSEPDYSWVFRDENVHIAKNCMALSGSTPKFPEQFNHEGFSIEDYYRSHLGDEMKEEYCLSKAPEDGEFSIGGIHLMNDTLQVPFGVVELTTPFSTRQLAERSYGQPQPMKEHGIFFSTDRNGLNAVLEQFDIFPSTARVMNMMLQE